MCIKMLVDVQQNDDRHAINEYLCSKTIVAYIRMRVIVQQNGSRSSDVQQ